MGSSAYFRQAPRPHTLSELSQHRCLIGSRPNWLFEVNGQRREVKVEGCWSANSGPALLDAALKGWGSPSCRITTWRLIWPVES